MGAKKFSKSETANLAYVNLFGSIRKALKPGRKLYGKDIPDGLSLFDAMDKDGDGSVDHDEFHVALKRLGLGITPQQVTQMLAVLDNNGDGSVTCAEFMYHLHGKSVLDVVRRAISVNGEMNGEALTDTRAAFNAMDEDGNGTLDKHEFRVALKSLGVNLTTKDAEELMDILDVDGGGEIDYEEFMTVLCQDLGKNGAASKHTGPDAAMGQGKIFKILQRCMKQQRKLYGRVLSDAQAAFQAMDRDNSGSVDTEEFREALERMGLGVTESQMDQLVAELDTDGDGEISYAEFMSIMQDGSSGASAEPTESMSQQNTTGKPTARQGPKYAKGCASRELKEFHTAFQPLAAKSAEAEALREDEWAKADPNGNGLCSLAELDGWILKFLMAKYPRTGKGREMVEKGKDLWKLFRPCYIRAHKDAADFAQDDGKTLKGTKSSKQDDFVSKDEFRIFNANMVIYTTMYDAFSKIDGGGAGIDAGDDRRIDVGEFTKAYKGVTQHGFLALEGLSSKKEAAKLFGRIDDNGGGFIMLEEWCEYIKAVEIEEGTALGLMLAEDEEGGVGKKWEKPTGKQAQVMGKKGKPFKPTPTKRKLPNTKSKPAGSPTRPSSGSPKLAATKSRPMTESEILFKSLQKAMKSSSKLYGHVLADAKSAFEAMDRDGSGALDHDEFKDAIKLLGIGITDEQCDALICELDDNGDGEIDYDEFMGMIHRGGKRASQSPAQSTVRQAAKPSKAITASRSTFISGVVNERGGDADRLERRAKPISSKKKKKSFNRQAPVEIHMEFEPDPDPKPRRQNANTTVPTTPARTPRSAATTPARSEEEDSTDGDDDYGGTSSEEEAEMNEVEHWLQSINLGQYWPNFEEDGWVDLDMVADMGEEDWKELGVGAEKKSHLIKMRNAAQQLQESN